MKHLLAVLVVFASMAFAQTAGPGLSTTYYASKSGARLDCVPLTGLTASGGACTNNDAVLNGILASATATNQVTLIVDGGTITNGIVGPATGYWTLDCQGWGNGFFIASGSNAHVIRNVSQSNGDAHWNVTPGTPGQNITIRNCFINGNRGNGTTGNSNSGNARQAPNGNWLYGVSLDNQAHALIEHNWFYDEPSFNLMMNACTDCTVDHNRFDAVSRALNQDGVHIDGPSAQVRVHDNWFNNTDDSIAVNAAEGYSGTVDGVAMSDNQCVLCLTAYRQLSNESGAEHNAAIKNITFTNGSGSLADSNGAPGVAFRLGELSASGGTADLMQSVRISNSTYMNTGASTGMVEVNDFLGELSISNVTWISPVSASPWINFGNTPVTISSYTCTACRIIRNTAGNAAAFWGKVPSGDSIARAECNGCSIENEQGQSYSALSYGWDVQSGGSIGTFVMTAMDPALNPTLLNGNEWSRITNFYGAGVSAYYRNTTYANLPPPTYKGLAASIGDSTTQTWGATAAGSSSSYAQITSDGSNWTVTGK